MDVIGPAKQAQMGDNPATMLPPRTPNYGKTPKYIGKYKEEFKQLQQEKEERRLAKFRPPGTVQISESERV